MHFSKSTSQWIFSLALLGGLLAIKGSPIPWFVFLPIILCRFIQSKKLEIVFASTLVWGVIYQNFFAVHVYGEDINKTINSLLHLPASSSLLEQIGLAMGALGLYLFIFIFLYFIVKKFWRGISFGSGIFLAIFFFAFSWVATLQARAGAFATILSLSLLMFSHHVFYVFNYVKFFSRLPRTKQEAFALFQPFWFLTFETPENAIIQQDSSPQESEQSIRRALDILISVCSFKVLLIIVMTLFYSWRSTRFEWVTSETDIFYKAFLPIFSTWKSQNVFLLLLTIFLSSFTYLISSFFVYGRAVVAVANLCGFVLPDYIDSPWRSSSFADFFSRVMYYYNIIIVNFFFYPALDFSRKFGLSKKFRIFICLNWALLFGGYFARMMKEVYQAYQYGFWQIIHHLNVTNLPYLVLLSLGVTVSLHFSKKPSPQSPIRIGRMLFYIFLYGLINPLNFSTKLGGLDQMMLFYVKIFSFGLIKV